MSKVAILMTNEVEDSEARKPYEALRAAGYSVEIVSPKAGEELQGKSGEFKISSDRAIAEARVEDYDLLVIPGGHSPDKLRTEEGAVELVAGFARANKPIAAICHGPQLLISANLVKGRKMTGYKSIAVDLKNAGALFEDSALVTDGLFITSRQPSDLPQFCEAILKALPAAARP